jgi:hypothetical protein
MPRKRNAAVVFVHGLAKKPPAATLLKIWVEGIERNNPRPDVFKEPNKGVSLRTHGVPHELTYYADVFYGEDYETDLSSYYEAEKASAESEIATDNIAEPTPAPFSAEPTASESEFIATLEREFARAIEKQPVTAVAAADTRAAAGLEIASLLPAPMREAIVKKAAMEAYYYLFDKEYTRQDGKRFRVRAHLRGLLLANLNSVAVQAEKIVLVSHSMGTMVAYDVLRNCPGCPPVDTLITIGSPLGIKEVQNELKADPTKKIDFPAATTRRWVNIYDPLDPICGADPNFSNDYQSVGEKKVQDVRESNWSKWRHTSTHYFAGLLFRKHLAEALGVVIA